MKKIVKSKPIEQLEEEAEKDLEIRIDRTEDDMARTPTIFNKYHREYRLVKTELINAQNALIRLRRKLWLYYSGKAHPNEYDKKPLDHKIMKSDVKLMIESDDEYLKLSHLIDMLEMKRKYIREKLDAINRRTYEINNIIRTLEFKIGK